MAESFNGLYKRELIYRQGPWRGIDDVEFATMSYVDWFNHRRLHGQITDGPGYTTPAEFEADYYRQTTRPSSRSPNEPSSHGTRGASDCDRPSDRRQAQLD
jgi:putative transposase